MIGAIAKAIFGSANDRYVRSLDRTIATLNALEPQITIPPEAKSVTIAADGTVSYTQPGQSAAQVAGQIQLANFANPAGLNSIGNNLYKPPTPAASPPSARPADRRASARCCKATSSSPTSASSRSSST